MSEVSGGIRVREDMYAGWLSAAVYSAARLRVADHLADGPLGVDELAERTGTDAGSRNGCSRAGRRRVLPRGGGPAVRDHPARRVPAQRHRGLGQGPGAVLGREVYRAYGALANAVRTGERAFDMEYGMPLWDYLNTVRSTSCRSPSPRPRITSGCCARAE
ncbi:Hydroxyneurosporene-O-methyltransferase OS=Streptomyces fumanus OX=67302 GN=GCM10018772_39400 PE=4 SV=1 [Streptomyces fumanus]